MEKDIIMDEKKLLQEELKKRGNLTMPERMLKVEILFEDHIKHHDRITRYLLYPILSGVVVSVILSIVTLVYKTKVIELIKK